MLVELLSLHTFLPSCASLVALGVGHSRWAMWTKHQATVALTQVVALAGLQPAEYALHSLRVEGGPWPIVSKYVSDRPGGCRIFSREPRSFRCRLSGFWLIASKSVSDLPKGTSFGKAPLLRARGRGRGVRLMPGAGRLTLW